MSHKANGWQEKPIFISSTFQDMHFERDYFRDVVFPNIERKLLPHHISVLPIDLRGGIVSYDNKKEEQIEKQVLQMCLSEIDRSRPFLIVLLGDRYGWLPPQSFINQQPDDSEYPFATDNLSVTALEIKYAILKQQFEHVFFYVREPLCYEDMPDSIKPVYHDKYAKDAGASKRMQLLEQLKSEMEQLVPKERFKRYSATWDPERQIVTGLEKLGEMIEADVVHSLIQHDSVPMERSWQREDVLLEQGVFLGKLHEFIEAEELPLQAIKVFMDTPEPGKLLILAGETGAGKTSLLAWVYSRLSLYEGALILTYQTHLNPLSSGKQFIERERVMRKWLYQLGELPNEGAGWQEVEAHFHHALMRQTKKVFILIDDYDEADNAEWLEKLVNTLPVTMIITKRPNILSVPDVQNKDYIHCKPFSERLSVQLLDRLRLRYGRQLAPNHVSQILGFEREDLLEVNRNVQEIKRTIPYDKRMHPSIRQFAKEMEEIRVHSAGNPLWLQLTFHQLLLLDQAAFSNMQALKGDEHEKVHRLIQQTIKTGSPTIEGMYALLLETLENRIGSGVSMVRSFFLIISGFEEELREAHLLTILERIMCFNEGHISDFIRLKHFYQKHFARTLGIRSWHFEHREAQKAVRKRYVHANPDDYLNLLKTAVTYLNELHPLEPFRLAQLSGTIRRYIQLHYSRTAETLQKKVEHNASAAELDRIRFRWQEWFSDINGLFEFSLQQLHSSLKESYAQAGKALVLYARVSPQMEQSLLDHLIHTPSQEGAEKRLIKNSLDLANTVYGLNSLFGWSGRFERLAEIDANHGCNWRELKQNIEIIQDIWSIWEKVLNS